MSELRASRAGRAAAAVLALVALATVAGLVALWPGDRPAGEAAGPPTVVADVERVDGRCDPGQGGPGCRTVTIRLDDGRRSTLVVPGGPLAPELAAGDRVRVARNAPGAPQPYAFTDFERRSPLLWLALLFAVLVVALGRFQGLRSLLGLAASLLVVVGFVAPAILDGAPPLPVALVGALAVMFLTIGLAHGTGLKSAAAMLGTIASLALTAALALAAVSVADITGLANEEALLLSGTTDTDVSLQGLVLAGMLIAALGVLDDVTVSQASTVLALRRANPAQRAGRLFREGLSVGRDHLSATVNTLVLAYAGAALPILLIFTNQRTSFGDAVNREPVAEEIVSMLVGSIGLIAAVPLTTALAAVLAGRIPADALPDAGHAHHH